MHFNHTKGLIGALAISGFLNIILLTSIFYGHLRERSPALYCEQKLTLKPSKQPVIAADESSSSLIRQLQTLPYEQVVAKLKSLTPVENGFTERDLALACLVACHHFDLSRALEGSVNVLQERLITYQQQNGTSATIKVYSALNNSQFALINAFAASERWPQTPKGLFHLLQKTKDNFEITLLDAFLLTPEFNSIEPLFKRTEPAVNKKEIINFLLEGDWALLSQTFEQQRINGEISDARRQSVLLDYVQKGSITAANLLLKIDSQYALKKLDDQQMVNLLTLLSQKSPENEAFAKAVLASPRNDAVLQMAAKRLYEYTGEKTSQKLSQSIEPAFVPSSVVQSTAPYPQNQIKLNEKPLDKPPVASKIVKQEKSYRYSSTASPKIPAPKSDRLYIVQEGDTLWKLSKRFNIEVEILKGYNKLSSDSLAPNSAIRIPVY